MTIWQEDHADVGERSRCRARDGLIGRDARVFAGRLAAHIVAPMMRGLCELTVRPIPATRRASLRDVSHPWWARSPGALTLRRTHGNTAGTMHTLSVLTIRSVARDATRTIVCVAWSFGIAVERAAVERRRDPRGGRPEASWPRGGSLGSRAEPTCTSPRGEPRSQRPCSGGKPRVRWLMHADWWAS